MKNSIMLLCLIFLVSCNETEKKTPEPQKETATEQKTTTAKPTKKKPLSPHTSAMAMVGDAHIHIDYSSPGVRGRIIFGGLVGYDNVWQAGAHNATWIETNRDILINENLLKAGKYGFFTIPTKDKWTIILNKNWNQHGKDDYNVDDDVLRFDVTPEIYEQITEQLTYQVEKLNNKEGIISLSWEKVSLSFPFVLSK